MRLKMKAVILPNYKPIYLKFKINSKLNLKLAD